MWYLIKNSIYYSLSAKHKTTVKENKLKQRRLFLHMTSTAYSLYFVRIMKHKLHHQLCTHSIILKNWSWYILLMQHPNLTALDSRLVFSRLGNLRNSLDKNSFKVVSLTSVHKEDGITFIDRLIDWCMLFFASFYYWFEHLSFRSFTPGLEHTTPITKISPGFTLLTRLTSSFSFTLI